MANPYVKQTWTDGVSSGSAARFAVLEQGVYDAHFQPTARVYHSAAQSIVTGTWTALAFNSERFDQDGLGTSTIHDNATNNSRLTCRVAGKYLICGSAQFAGSAAGTQRGVRVFLNAATVIGRDLQPHGGFAGALDRNITVEYDLAVNDYVELQAFQDSGGGLNVDVAANLSPEFSMVRVA